MTLCIDGPFTVLGTVFLWGKIKNHRHMLEIQSFVRSFQLHNFVELFQQNCGKKQNKITIVPYNNCY